MAAIAPTRFDVVGSFLRPEALKEARAAHAAGKLDDAGLIAVEDACIAELVAKPDVDGALVGGASLKAADFASMVVKAGE